MCQVRPTVFAYLFVSKTEHHSLAGAAPNGPHPYPPPPPANGDRNEFRARFRGPIEAPSPFPTYPADARVDPAISTATAGPSGASAGPSNDSIDPHLGGRSSTSTEGTTPKLNDKAAISSSIDPNLAQAKTET